MGSTHFINLHVLITLLMLCFTGSLFVLAWSIENQKFARYTGICVRSCMINLLFGFISYLLDSRGGEVVFVMTLITAQVVYVLNNVMEYLDDKDKELIINAGLYVIVTSTGLIMLLYVNPIKIGI